MTNKNELKKLLVDMINDITNTFPELTNDLDENLRNILNDVDIDKSINNLIDYFKNIYPERFFDIIYENDDIFSINSEVNVYFLPGINFKNLWNDNITDNTRKTLWKYLQLILFSIVSEIDNKDLFGNTENLFQVINEEDFKNKLQDTINDIQNIFSNNFNEDLDISNNFNNDFNNNYNKDFNNDFNNDFNKDFNKDLSFNIDDLPSPENIHEHINGMLNGKLGLLANEIAGEIANETKNHFDLSNGDIGDIFNKLLKDPMLLMKLVKKIGNKINVKLQSGELKESELLKEANEMMMNMKNMPGMDNFKDLFTKMGVNSTNKMNLNAMQSQMNKNINLAKQKERMREKLKKNVEKESIVDSIEDYNKKLLKSNKAMEEFLKNENLDNNFVFKKGEGALRSNRNENEKNKNKNKNNKNKKNKKNKKKNKK